jgi:hypothetical protein
MRNSTLPTSWLLPVAKLGKIHSQYLLSHQIPVILCKILFLLKHNPDQEIGVYMIDRFTYYTLRFFEKVTPASKATVGQLFRSYDPSLVMSKPGYRTDLFKRNIDKVLITDFFGSVRNVQLMQSLPVAVTTRSSLPNQTGDFSGSDISNLTWSSSDFQSDGEQGLPQWADSVQFTMALVVFLTAVFLAVIWR